MVAHFAGLPGPRKWVYIEAMTNLIGAWGLVRGLPFTQWRPMLKPSPKAKQLEDLAASELDFLLDLQHVLKQMKWATGDRATCLMLVLVARWMLNRRRIPGTIFFGVRRDKTKPGLHAHAWMESAVGVVGHESAAEFAIVEKF